MEEMKKRLAEIVARLQELKAVENHSKEELEEIQALGNESKELNQKIEAQNTIDSVLNTVQTSTRKTQTSTQNSSIVVGEEQKLTNGIYGYDTAGEYFSDVRKKAEGTYTEKLQKAKKYQASQRESVGADGGFLVPTDILDGVQSAIESDMSLLSRCRSLNVSGNKAELRINEAAPWTGNGQNITAYWVGEGQKIDKSSAKFKDVTIKAEKLAALIHVSEEMAEDSSLVESFIREETPEVFVAAINNAIINGDGVKKPEGMLQSAFGFEVPKEVGQTADTVVFNNLKKLHTHALPRAKRNGIYVYNAAVEEELIGMKLDPSSTDSVSVYLPNNSIDGAPYGTLWGKPAFPMIGAMPALGDKGDICFMDLSYYYAILKVGGLKQRISTDFLFDTDEMAFKYTFRMGGLCPFSAPQGTEYGDYKLSGFTYLQERA